MAQQEGPCNVGDLHDDDEDDQIGLLHAKQHGADNRGEVHRHHDAGVVDDEGGDELEELAVVAGGAHGLGDAAEADLEVGIAGGQGFRLAVAVDDQEDRDGREGEIGCGDEEGDADHHRSGEDHDQR